MLTKQMLVHYFKLPLFVRTSIFLRFECLHQAVLIEKTDDIFGVTVKFPGWLNCYLWSSIATAIRCACNRAQHLFFQFSVFGIQSSDFLRDTTLPLRTVIREPGSRYFEQEGLLQKATRLSLLYFLHDNRVRRPDSWYLESVIRMEAQQFLCAHCSRISSGISGSLVSE